MENIKKKEKTWLCFMLFPFIIGVGVHFLVPIEFIVSSNPKIEQAYNARKIEVEQETIRTISQLNAAVFRNYLQMYENVRGSFMRILTSNFLYEQIIQQEYQMNNVDQLISMNESQIEYVDFKKSMWLIANGRNLSQATIIEKLFYKKYLQIEPYIYGFFKNKSELFEGVEKIITILNYKNIQFLYAEYPSRVVDDRQQKKKEITNRYHKTMTSYFVNGIDQTLFLEGESLEICEPLFKGRSILGISCLRINLRFLMGLLIKTLKVPEYQLSQNEYLIVRPLYQGIDLEDSPQVIIRFSDRNLSNVTFPNEVRFDKPVDIPTSLFYPRNQMAMSLFRDGSTLTYYIFPIFILNYESKLHVDLFMITRNNFAKADLNFDEKKHQMYLSIFLSSCLMSIISVLITILVLKCLLRAINTVVKQLNEYCKLMLRSDLVFQIPDHHQNSDFADIFHQFSILNELNKYSDPNFFDVPQPERIVKFLKCWKLFKKLNYDCSNLCQNIADCYCGMHEFSNSIKFLQLSLRPLVKIFEKQVLPLKQLTRRKLRQLLSEQKKIQKVLIRRLNKLVQTAYSSFVFEEEQGVDLEETLSNVQLLKKVVYPRIETPEYLTCLIIELRLMQKVGKAQGIETHLDSLYALLQIYEKEREWYSQQNLEYSPPPNILFSYWWFIKANLLIEEGKPLEAFKHLVEAITEKIFYPPLHRSILMTISELLQKYRIETSGFQKMLFQKNYQKRGNREYLFIIDNCLPQISENRVKNWKKQTKNAVSFIFKNFIHDQDRISIMKFASFLQIVNNLRLKSSQEKAIRKELLNTIRSDEDEQESNVLECLDKAIKRVSHLQLEKIFLIFVRPTISMNGQSAAHLTKKITNSQFLFFFQDPQIISTQEGFFTLELANPLNDLTIILEEKTHKPADTHINLF